jgi:hypothetical protein
MGEEAEERRTAVGNSYAPRAVSGLARIKPRFAAKRKRCCQTVTKGE